jgi:hypothetical protein
MALKQILLPVNSVSSTCRNSSYIQQWAGHVVRIDGSRILQKAMDVSDLKGSWESLEVDGIMQFRGKPCMCSRYGTGRRQQKREKDEGNRGGYGPKTGQSAIEGKV